MLRKILIIFILVLSLVPMYKLHAQSSNAGFVPGNIWYSKDPFEERDVIKIYTIVFNPDAKELSGTVSFFDKNVLLGKKSFIVEGLGVQDISVSWTATAGEHVIFARIENARFLTSDGNYENITLNQSETEESKRTVAKKIIAEETKEEESVVLDTDILKNVILERTPRIISEPIIGSVNAVEEFRSNQAETVSVKKEEVKKEIASMKDIKSSKEGEKERESSLDKPFKYTKLFLLNILSLFLKNAFVFYGSSLVIVFFVARYILGKIF
ncbi:hypothetical protein K8Q98_00385 [Candidatus Nomurabacteria bacterium]|nr:hypothetical protein [Candidatus Nomurabacteria bacterium]